MIATTDSYWYRKTLQGLQITSLVIWSHPFVGIYFVNNGTNSVSFKMVRTKKNILSKCFCSVTHGVHNFTTFVQQYVDMIQSMNGIVC